MMIVRITDCTPPLKLLNLGLLPSSGYHQPHIVVIGIGLDFPRPRRTRALDKLVDPHRLITASSSHRLTPIRWASLRKTEETYYVQVLSPLIIYPDSDNGVIQ